MLEAMLKKNYIRIILRFLTCILLNAILILVAFLILHLIRYIQTPAPTGLSGHGFEFLSRTEFVESCRKWPTISSIIVTSALGFSAAFVLGGITKHVKDNKWLTSKLKDAAEDLVLQARNTIPDFKDVLVKADEMMKRVDKEPDSEVKLALFWPMFGADQGDKFFKSQGKLTEKFHDKTENLFYYYLFKRFVHNLPTELLFLDYKKKRNQNSKLFHFIEVLSKYTKDPEGVPFFTNNVKYLEQKVVSHIRQELIPRNRSNEYIEIRVTDDIPVLLFIIENKRNNPDVIREGLLFIGNVHMMEKQHNHGGFYTQKPEMIDILGGLFASLFKYGKTI